MRGSNDELIWGEKELMTQGPLYWRTPERPAPKYVMTIDLLEDNGTVLQRFILVRKGPDAASTALSHQLFAAWWSGWKVHVEIVEKDPDDKTTDPILRAL